LQTQCAAPLLHEFDALQRFERAQQHACPHAGLLAGHVQQIRHAIDEIDVSMAASQEQRAIARSLPAKCMSGGVADDVGFGLDDAPAGATLRGLVHQRLADEIARQLDGICRQRAAPQPAHARCAGNRR